MNISTRLSMSERRSIVLLAGYLAVAALCLAFLPDLIRRGWFSGGPGHITRTVLTAPEAVGITLGMMQASAVGIFLGILGVMLLDSKKQLQAAVFLVTSILLAPLLVVASDFVPELFRTPVDAIIGPLVAGILVGVLICLPSNPLLLLDRNWDFDFEFRRGAWIIHKLVLIAIVAMFLEATIVYPPLDGLYPPLEATVTIQQEHIVTDALVVAGLWFSLRQFMQYDRSTIPFVVGPSGSGKTYFMIGALLNDLHNAEATVREKSRTLDHFIAKIESSVRNGRTDRWHVDNTDSGQAEPMWYKRVSQGILPKNVMVNSLDYAGENLAGLATVLESSRDISQFSDTEMPPGASIDDVIQLKKYIDNSDILVLLLDAEEIFRGRIRDVKVRTDGGVAADKEYEQGQGRTADEWPASEIDDTTEFDSYGSDFEAMTAYEPILSAYGDEKRIVFAVTKADVLDELFETQYDLNIYREENIDEFARLLYQELQTSETVSARIDQAGADEVYPVYFRTKVIENGHRVPVRPEGGSLSPFGFHRLMEDL